VGPVDRRWEWKETSRNPSLCLKITAQLVAAPWPIVLELHVPVQF
jgi:hypothetical protein